MTVEYWVEVVDRKTKQVVQRLGPKLSMNLADKIESGLDRQINHAQYFSRIVKEAKKPKQKKAKPGSKLA